RVTHEAAPFAQTLAHMHVHLLGEGAPSCASLPTGLGLARRCFLAYAFRRGGGLRRRAFGAARRATLASRLFSHCVAPQLKLALVANVRRSFVMSRSGC